jgi:hypothetical protein
MQLISTHKRKRTNAQGGCLAMLVMKYLYDAQACTSKMVQVSVFMVSIWTHNLQIFKHVIIDPLPGPAVTEKKQSGVNETGSGPPKRCQYCAHDT